MDLFGAATQISYWVWGAARDAISNLPTCRLYTGQEKGNTGLYYYNARWYDSDLGRFVQPDTILPDPYNPLTLDRFTYTTYNQINRVIPIDMMTALREQKVAAILLMVEEDNLIVKGVAE